MAIVNDGIKTDRDDSSHLYFSNIVDTIKITWIQKGTENNSCMKKNLFSSIEYQAAFLTWELQKSQISGCLENIWIKYHYMLVCFFYFSLYFSDRIIGDHQRHETKADSVKPALWSSEKGTSAYPA